MKLSPTPCIIIAVLLVSILTGAARAQDTPFYAVAFRSQNYTQCNETSDFTVRSVERSYNPADNTFHFHIIGNSSVAVTNVSTAQNMYASAKTEVLLGNTVIYSNLTLLCPDLVNGCPVAPNSPVEIEHSFTLPNTSIPIGDLTVLYMTQTGDENGWACLALAPVGYQHPVWKAVFRYVPIAFTVFVALVSFFASFATVSDTQHDIFLFTSNYAMLPAALRIKTPGFFDLIYYAQFIVLTSQLNLAYPKFYSLFAANFSWSFLMLPTSWIQQSTTTMFDMGIANGTARFDMKNSLPVEGTGINNYATTVGIDINSLFMSGLIFLLIILLCVGVLCGFIWCVVQAMAWYAPYRYAAQGDKMWNFTLGILLRVMTLFYLPMMTLSFCQLMLPAPVVILMLAAIVLVFHIFLLYGFIAFLLLDVRPSALVFSDMKLLMRYGSLYNTFTDDHFYFFLYGLIYRIVTGAVVGWINLGGQAQVIVVFVFEILYLVLHVVRWPYASRSANAIHAIFAAFRTVSVLLSLLYIESLEISDTSKQAIGWTQIILHFILFFIMFAIPVRNLVVLITGLGDDEIYERGAPPARMVWWRRQRPFGSIGMRSKQDHMPVSTMVPAEEEHHKESIDLSSVIASRTTIILKPAPPPKKRPNSLPLQSRQPTPSPPTTTTTAAAAAAASNGGGWKITGRNRNSFFNVTNNNNYNSSSRRPSPIGFPAAAIDNNAIYQPLMTSNHHDDNRVDLRLDLTRPISQAQQQPKRQ